MTKINIVATECPRSLIDVHPTENDHDDAYLLAQFGIVVHPAVVANWFEEEGAACEQREGAAIRDRDHYAALNESILDLLGDAVFYAADFYGNSLIMRLLRRFTADEPTEAGSVIEMLYAMWLLKPESEPNRLTCRTPPLFPVDSRGALASLKRRFDERSANMRFGWAKAAT